MKIYLAHPYGGDRENIGRAGELARTLKEEHPDWVIFSPLHNFAWETYDENEREQQMKDCLDMLEACDAVYFADGWEYSLGCITEMVWAMKKRKALMIEETDEEEETMTENKDMTEEERNARRIIAALKTSARARGYEIAGAVTIRHTESGKVYVIGEEK